MKGGLSEAYQNLLKFTKEVNLLTSWIVFKVSSGKIKKTKTLPGEEGQEELFLFYPEYPAHINLTILSLSLKDNQRKLKILTL